jgi:hypothetical protein
LKQWDSVLLSAAVWAGHKNQAKPKIMNV